MWFLCMCYVAFILNRVSDSSLSFKQPHLVATGQVADISAITSFQWMEPVYYKLDSSEFSFPQSNEAMGYFVGFSDTVGHELTFQIYLPSTGKIVDRSAVRSAIMSDNWNLRAASKVDGENTSDPTFEGEGFQFQHEKLLDTSGEYKAKPRRNLFQRGKKLLKMGRELFLKQELDVEDSTQFIYRKGEKPNYTTPYPENDYFEEKHPSALNKKVRFSTDGKQLVPLTDENGIPKLDSAGKQIFIPGKLPKQLQGITFKRRFDDGTVKRATVLEPILEPNSDNCEDEKGLQELGKFKIKYNEFQVEDTLAYNKIMNYLHPDELEEDGHVWAYRKILSHAGLFTSKDPQHRGSSFNSMVEWENGNISEEPLNWMIKEYPIPVAQYAI